MKRPDQRANPGSNRSCCIIGIFHLSGGIQIATASASSVIHVSSCGNAMCGPTKPKNPWRRPRRVLAFGKNQENVGSSSNADAYVAAMRSLSKRVALRICSMDQYLPKKWRQADSPTSRSCRAAPAPLMGNSRTTPTRVNRARNGRPVSVTREQIARSGALPALIRRRRGS